MNIVCTKPEKKLLKSVCKNMTQETSWSSLVLIHLKLVINAHWIHTNILWKSSDYPSSNMEYILGHTSKPKWLNPTLRGTEAGNNHIN